jgi:integrase
MARPKGTYNTPSYRLHKASGRAIVTIDGRDHYLGEYGSPESREKYNRVVAEFLLRGRQSGPLNDPTTTVDQLLAAWLQKIANHTSAGDFAITKIAAKWLSEHYGETPAAEFSAVKLRALRERMTTAHVTRRKHAPPIHLSRHYVNKLVRRIQIAFRWGAEHGLSPASAYHEAALVQSLRAGRSEARETRRVMPADQRDIDAVLEVATPTIAAMIQLQLLTGARPGELCSMRGRDLDVSGAIWRYTPAHHKTEHCGRERTIFIGPKAQEILRPYLKPDLTAPLFSPVQAGAERTYMATSGKHRGVPANRRGTPATCTSYTSENYGGTIRHLVERAERVAHDRRPEVPADQRIVKRWHPHQLRHNAATYLRQQFGIDVARTVLGHSSIAMTEIYAEADLEAAKNAIAKVG